MASKKTGGISSLIQSASQEIKRDLVAKDIASIVDGDSAPVGPKIFSILDYIEQPWGLNMRLYPAQRFLVKLYYFLPLDEHDKTITVTDIRGASASSAKYV